MKVKLCMQVKFDTTIMVFKQHVCNNVTCLKQQQQSLAIHYDRDHSHSIVSNNVLVAGATRNNTLSNICTGYDVIIVCPYVIAII